MPLRTCRLCEFWSSTTARTIRAIFAALLRRLGCEVQSLNDPGPCVNVVRQFRPQLVFLDIGMPRTDGLQVAAALRAENLGRFLLVARTGYADADLKRKCLDAGFDLVLYKPDEITAVRQTLDAARQLPEPGDPSAVAPPPPAELPQRWA